MDVLIDKQYKSYNYISRYSTFPFYYNTLDDKYIYGILSQLTQDNVQYVLHYLVMTDTLESLADYYYGRPDLYWVIAMYNNIQDSFIDLKEKYDELKIPTLTNITFNK